MKQAKNYWVNLCAVSMIVLCANNVQAQRLQLNLLGGFSNYSGDITQANFSFRQAQGVMGFGASYYLKPQLAVRLDYNSGRVKADDKLNGPIELQQRNLNFTSKIQDISLRLEYDVNDFTYHSFSPYVFGGISGFKYDPFTTDATGATVYLRPLSTEGQGLTEYPDRKVYKNIGFAWLGGGGVKYALSDDITLGFELGYRKTNTDYLDDVSANYVDEATLLAARGATAVALAWRGDEKANPIAYPADGSTRGSAKHKDYYYFGQFRISVGTQWLGGAFNKKPKYGCPVRIR